ncbi:MAG: AfsR/SARP family transcriptional regulator [Stackebrandtia sp.]
MVTHPSTPAPPRPSDAAAPLSPAPGGIGLTGPGTAGAARACIIAALDSGVDVVIAASDLETLYDGPGADIDIDPLWIMDSPQAGLALLEREIALRTCATDGGQQWPGVILITREDIDLQVLQSRLDCGRGVNVTALQLGGGLRSSVEVDAAGVATRATDTAAPPRVAMASTGDVSAAVTRLATSAQIPADPVTPASGSAAESMVRLRLLGGIDIKVGERVITSQFRGRAIEMLAYMASHRDGATRQALKNTIMCDNELKDPAGTFRTVLSSARRLLAAATGHAGSDIITETDKKLRLAPHVFTVDLWDFADTVRDAKTGNDPTDALAQALDYYGGDFAADTALGWTANITTRLRGMATTTALDLATLHTAADRHAQAVAVLKTACGHDPYNEDIYRALMHAHAAAGNPGSITDVLTTATIALSGIDTTVSATTKDLAEQLTAKSD